VIRSKWLTMGDLTKRFESTFAEFTGSRHAVAMNSCTAALHVALQCLDIKPGDEVICPSLAFVATANAVLYCGATPVFADVESLKDWNISSRTIQAVVSDRTRAIIVVHYGGYPCEMPAIMDFARSRRLAVVEDVAHAPGGKLDGVAMGAWGDAGCFSFFSNKNMTTGEGGMLTTDRADIAERAGRIRSHGMTTLTLDRDRGHAFGYDVLELGYNYRMGELNAAVGLVQLGELQARNRRRHAVAERYRRNLGECSGLGLPFLKARGDVTYHLFPVLLPASCERQPIMQRMRDEGVQTSIHYRPIDTFTSYRKAGLGPQNNLAYTHTIGERVLSLPIFPSMTPCQVDQVSATLKRAISATT
ncbi:MAG: DegT/DnrJ/EryC1/StrS family aminotransferase, partial [Pseudomonadota bacterium]|nr:DegT/DnrJ/EryC1/StrS family aminotransferase [Pseudomonadota bacterium]